MKSSNSENVGDGAYRVWRTTDPGEAQRAVAEAYVPNTLTLEPGVRDLAMELRALRLGSLTVGRLEFGRVTTVTAEHPDKFRVCLPIRGSAVTTSGQTRTVQTRPGEAAVLPPDVPVQMVWSTDCRQLVLMVSRETLEWELEKLLGHSLKARLEFDLFMPPRSHAPGIWRSAVDMVSTELTTPSGLATLTSAALHAQGVVLDALLLGHHHNYRDEIGAQRTSGRTSAIRQAMELLHAHPERPWTAVGLAQEVHLSVRALHEGFTRDVDMPPMTYLRHLRLQRVRAELQAADPQTTTVRAVASRLGILHMGRFAAAYREAFGERPSETLGRASR